MAFWGPPWWRVGRGYLMPGSKRGFYTKKTLNSRVDRESTQHPWVRQSSSPLPHPHQRNLVLVKPPPPYHFPTTVTAIQGLVGVLRTHGQKLRLVVSCLVSTFKSNEAISQLKERKKRRKIKGKPPNTNPSGWTHLVNG